MPFFQMKPGPASLDVSIVIPVYNEELNVESLSTEINRSMENAPWTWECLWVDDRSTDGTFEKLLRLHTADPRHHALRLAAHEGQSAALAVGVSRSRGRYIATLDGDGQSDPADVARLLALLSENDLHVVNGRRARRPENFVRKASSRIANAFRNAVTGDRVTDVGCSLRVFRREAVDGIFVFKGMHRFLPTLIKMNGYDKIAEISVSHRPRRYGRTKYGISNRLWVGIADTLAVRWMRGRIASPRVGESSADEPLREGSRQLEHHYDTGPQGRGPGG